VLNLPRVNYNQKQVEIELNKTQIFLNGGNNRRLAIPATFRLVNQTFTISANLAKVKGRKDTV
jgi:hypothetical protein